MKFAITTDRLYLRVLSSEYAPQVLDFYKNNRDIFEKYEPIISDEFYTLPHQKKVIDFEYQKVRMTDKEIVFTGGNECRVYTIKGGLKFSYVFSKNIVDLIPTGYSRRYIILYDNDSEVIRLKHSTEKEVQ